MERPHWTLSGATWSVSLWFDRSVARSRRRLWFVEVLVHDVARREREREADDGCDQGPGFDVATTPPGMGMQIMQDRVDALAGELRMTSEPGHGTTVRGRLPAAIASRGGGAER